MEEKLVLEYIGKNADKIVNKKLNWPAAIMSIFFGPAWFFYRKSYLLGFAFMYFIGSGYYYIGLGALTDLSQIIRIVIIFLVYLFFANTLYLWDVRRKVKKIMSSSLEMSEEQLISIVKKKGGTSVAALTIYIVINVISKICLLVSVMAIKGSINTIYKFDFKKFWDELSHFPRIG